MHHILLTGEIGAGKSTLAQRLLAQSRRPVFGFVTQRVAPGADGVARTYIHPATGERVYSEANLVGWHDGKAGHGRADVFDAVGAPLLVVPKHGLLLMDELGFFENDAAGFQAGVLQALGGDVPVLAVVKQRHTPFLDAVRAQQSARLYCVARETRDALYAQLLPVVQVWNGGLA